MPNKKVRKMRGPSRPVDPRYAPGPAPKKGVDTFGIALVGTIGALVLLIILWVALTQGNTSTTTTTTSLPTQSVDLAAQATQQALSVGTQVIKDATETATLPRIEPKDAIAEVSSGSAKIIDVRAADAYLIGHIKGATNIQESESTTRLSEFPKLGNLIIYCQ